MDADTAPAHSRARSILIGATKAAISLALLTVLVSRVDASRLWHYASQASLSWLAAALLLYLAMILVSAWRWGQLLTAQGVALPYRSLTASFLVATFFNNFLPSNIGGDVVRIADTAKPAGSRTLATTVVLMDRGLGLLGLALMAAMGASAGRFAPATMGPVGPRVLWAGFGAAAMVATPALMMPERAVRLLQPLRVFHRDWVDERLNRLTAALVGFREAPAAIASCFAGAVLVQAILVAFYLAVAHSMRIPVGFGELAVIVPISFIVQMLPVSVNGFGVREATFGFYFSRLGLSLEAALLVSFVGAALILLFSLSGGAVYLARSVYRSA